MPMQLHDHAFIAVMLAAKRAASVLTGGIEAMGKRLGKRPLVLRKELGKRTADNSGKLGLLDTLRIMRVGGDLSPMHAICLEFGHMALPLPDVAKTSPCADVVATLAREFGELVAEYAQAMADERVTNVEFADVTHAWLDLVAAGHVLMSDAAARNAALNARQGLSA